MPAGRRPPPIALPDCNSLAHVHAPCPPSPPRRATGVVAACSRTDRRDNRCRSCYSRTCPHPPTHLFFYLPSSPYLPLPPPPRSLFRDSSDNSSGTTRQGQLVRDNALSQRPVTGDDGGVEVRAPAPWAAWTAGHWRAGGGVTRTPQRGHGSREGSAPPVVAHRERGHVQSNKGGGEEGGGGSPPTCGCCSLLERRACVIGDTYGCAAPIA